MTTPAFKLWSIADRPSRRQVLSAALAAAATLVTPYRRTLAGALRGGTETVVRAPQALIAAVGRGDLPTVSSMLDDEPALLRAVDDVGRSMFVLAHLAGHRPIAEMLRARGLELDVVEAVLAEDAERLAALLQAHPELANQDHPIGGTPHYAAARMGRRGMVFPLNRWGGDPNANPRGRLGVTAVRAAMDCADPLQRDLVALSLLGDAGDPNAPQRDGDTVLHGAVRAGSEFLVKLVIRKGGLVDATNASGQTPLDVAVQLGHRRVADILRNHQTIPRDHRTSRLAKDASGRPYRPIAKTDIAQFVTNEFSQVCHFDFDRVKTLLKEHPDLVHTTATWNEMGIEACAHMGRRDMAGYLLQRGAPMALPTSIVMGELAQARALLREDKNRVFERGPHDFALMWYPEIAGGSIEAAELLIEYGGDVNEDKYGWTALHRCAWSGRRELAAFLIEKGADLNAVGTTFNGSHSGTPLVVALDRGHSKVADLLKSAGAR